MPWTTVARSVGAQIRKLRKSAGLTIEELAHRAEVDAAFLGGVERGQQNPSLKTLTAVSTALGASLPELVNVDKWTELAERPERELLADLRSRLGKLSADELRLVTRVLDAMGL